MAEKIVRLKSDYDDVNVYRDGTCLYAEGNPENVRAAVTLALDRVVYRGVYGIDLTRPGASLGNYVKHVGKYADVWLCRKEERGEK